MIENWLDHMASVRDSGWRPTAIRGSCTGQDMSNRRWRPPTTQPHDATHSAAPAWASPNWFDLLKLVIKAQPVVVRGAHGFGLKAMSKAMHKAGLVTTQWTDGPTDGLGAMVAAWTCQQEVPDGHAARLEDLDLMQEVRAYNKTDCQAMHDVLRHLRSHH